MDVPFGNPLPANLLTSMVTPAVLISAAGTLVFSTTTRLARIVDRARELGRMLEELESEPDALLAEEKRREIGRQLQMRARRSHLVQSAVTRFYFALGCFVAATVALGLASLVPALAWLPGAVGVTGTAILFAGCVQLIRETRVAVDAVDEEMAFTLRLGELRREAGRRRPDGPAAG